MAYVSLLLTHENAAVRNASSSRLVTLLDMCSDSAWSGEESDQAEAAGSHPTRPLWLVVRQLVMRAYVPPALVIITWTVVLSASVSFAIVAGGYRGEDDDLTVSTTVATLPRVSPIDAHVLTAFLTTCVVAVLTEAVCKGLSLLANLFTG